MTLDEYLYELEREKEKVIDILDRIIDLGKEFNRDLYSRSIGAKEDSSVGL